jgi:DNA-binding XRE family transcriptional regulator
MKYVLVTETNPTRINSVSRPRSATVERQVSAMQPFTVEQARAARAFLGWSQHELGDAAGLSFETIRNFERDDQSATKKSITAIRTAFHDAGVEFHRRGERVGVTIVVWSQPW